MTERRVHMVRDDLRAQIIDNIVNLRGVNDLLSKAKRHASANSKEFEAFGWIWNTAFAINLADTLIKENLHGSRHHTF